MANIFEVLIQMPGGVCVYVTEKMLPPSELLGKQYEAYTSHLGKSEHSARKYSHS